MRFAPVLLVVALASPAFADRTVRTLDDVQPAAGVDKVHLEFSVGQLTIEPSTDRNIHFTVKVRCKDNSRRCEERAEELEIEARRIGSTLKIEIPKTSGWDSNRATFRAVLLMPADLALRLEMGVGELTISGLAHDVDVNLGVGEARLRLDENHVREVTVSSGVGDASLRVGKRNLQGSGWLGHSVRWDDGPGRARIEVDLGVGETEVVLD
jgi:prolyl-tRNA editing enzyme YbaK/EbsC (Cys-tRNA(Pro) deacylase)